MQMKLMYSDCTLSNEIIMPIYNFKTGDYNELIFEYDYKNIFNNSKYKIFKLIGVK